MHKTNIIILFPFIYNNTNNNNTDDRNSKIIPGLAFLVILGLFILGFIGITLTYMIWFYTELKAKSAVGAQGYTNWIT